MNRIFSLCRALTRRYIKGKELRHSAQSPKTTSDVNATGTALIHRIVNNNRTTKDRITLDGIPKFGSGQGKLTKTQIDAFYRLAANARKAGRIR